MSSSSDLVEFLSYGVRILLMVGCNVALLVVAVTSLRRADATAGTCVAVNAVLNLVASCIGWVAPVLMARMLTLSDGGHVYRRWYAVEGLVGSALSLVGFVLMITALTRLARVATKALRDAKPQAF